MTTISRARFKIGLEPTPTRAIRVHILLYSSERWREKVAGMPLQPLKEQIVKFTWIVSIPITETVEAVLRAEEMRTAGAEARSKQDHLCDREPRPAKTDSLSPDLSVVHCRPFLLSKLDLKEAFNLFQLYLNKSLYCTYELIVVRK